MAAFVGNEAAMRIYAQVGSDTDIGGGRENQDDYFVWKSDDSTILVLCVLDGHGREVGKIAANHAHVSLKEFFQSNHHVLRTTPYECLVEAHELAHRRIKIGFREELEREGYEVEEAPEGYLLKRMPPSQFWGCVHGGSSCSIVAIVDHMVYIANVGDSSGTLSTTVPVLSSALLRHIGDAASLPGAGVIGKSSISNSSKEVPSSSSTSEKHSGGGSSASESVSDAMETDAVEPCQDNLVITAEHSPESPSEFCRLRAFRARPGDPRQPALVIVYDSPSADKTKCAPVFSLNSAGVPTVLNKGKYYKNVRKEWASLVSTPSSARFQDALAFTRSLGDLHLHTFGVTHLPEVQSFDLREVFGKISSQQRAVAGDRKAGVESEDKMESTASEETASLEGSPIVCLVLATDGVWDNWTYEDVTKFVMDASCLKAVSAGNDGAERIAKAFMQRNAIYARRNFGAQADNASGILVYLSLAPLVSPQIP